MKRAEVTAMIFQIKNKNVGEINGLSVLEGYSCGETKTGEFEDTR